MVLVLPLVLEPVFFIGVGVSVGVAVADGVAVKVELSAAVCVGVDFGVGVRAGVDVGSGRNESRALKQHNGESKENVTFLRRQKRKNSCGHTTDFYLGKTDLPRAKTLPR